MAKSKITLVTLALLLSTGASCAQERRPSINFNYTCSGKVGPYSTGIADRSIGGGDNMCYFVSQSPVGRSILAACKVGSNCRVVGTVKEAGEDDSDWSPIITDVVSIRKKRTTK